MILLETDQNEGGGTWNLDAAQAKYCATFSHTIIDRYTIIKLIIIALLLMPTIYKKSQNKTKGISIYACSPCMAASQRARG